MKIPNEVKIGSHTYKIERIKSIAGTGLGQMIPWELKIKLMKKGDAGDSLIEEAFLHEIIEAIKNQFQIDLSHYHLTVLSELLYQTLKTNKLKF